MLWGYQCERAQSCMGEVAAEGFGCDVGVSLDARIEDRAVLYQTGRPGVRALYRVQAPEPFGVVGELIEHPRQTDIST